MFFRAEAAVLTIALAFCTCGITQGVEKPKTAGKPKTPPAATPAPKLEIFVMLPEPKAMRSDRSLSPPDAKATVISPARQTAESPGVRPYTAEEFAKLGISVDTFLSKARTAADRRLTTLQPDYVKDDSGHLRYAVYRGDSPLIASLLVAPSLGPAFQKLFGVDVWALIPDRNSLFLFPAKSGAIDEFSEDLRERYMSNPFAASPEIFLLKADGTLPQVVGAFAR